MRMILSRSVLPALLISAAATAMPPPVSLAPMVLSPAEDSKERAELVDLIQAMGREGHFTLEGIRQEDLAPHACWKDYRPDAACLAKAAPAWVENEPALTVVIDAPHWRQASVRIRCIGPDVARARQIELYLFDARANHPEALQEKAKLAGCMIGALHGAPEERG